MTQISGQVKRQILVVGDGKTFARFMNVLLVRMGLPSHHRRKRGQALRLARLFRPDVITLDMDMLATEGHGDPVQDEAGQVPCGNSGHNC